MNQSIQINQVKRQIFFPTENPRSRMLQGRKDFDTIQNPMVEIGPAITPILTELTRTALMTVVSYDRWIIFSAKFINPTDYMVTTGTYIIIRSSDLQWWRIAPNSAGIMESRKTTFAGTPRSTDWSLGGSKLSFDMGSFARQLFVSARGIIQTPILPPGPGGVIYFSTTIAFNYGYGLVFTDGLTSRRITVDTTGVLRTPLA